MSNPELAVVIAAYNAAATLGECLSAVSAAARVPIEVIVVDDGSTDETAAIAQGVAVRLIRLERNHGAAFARNAGVAASTAPLIFFLDADIVVPQGFLDEVFAAMHARPEYSALFCSYTPESGPGDVYSRHKNLIHHWTHQNSSEEAATFCGGFGAIRREVFLRMGGFDAAHRFLEDIELGYRLHQAGHRIRLAKQLQATHLKRYTLRSLLWSDAFGRAAPWTQLMLRHGIFRNDLNTRTTNVLSVPAVCLLPVAVVIDPALRVAACLVLLFVWLNRHYLRLAARRYGVVFTVQSAFLCALSYIASAVGMSVGVWTWLRDSGGAEAARKRLTDAGDA